MTMIFVEVPKSNIVLIFDEVDHILMKHKCLLTDVNGNEFPFILDSTYIEPSGNLNK